MTTQIHADAPPPKPLGPGDPDYDAWWSEVQHYVSIREELLQRPELRSKYISLLKHQIIDTGTDQFELGRRAVREHPGEVVLVVKVEPEFPRIELPGFEIL